MSAFQIALAAFALAALAGLLGWAWGQGRRSRGTAEAPQERIDTVAGWPPTPTRLLNGPERAALGTLMRALPEYMILSQVPLSRFVNVPKRYSYADWLRRIGYQCVDFVVCDMAAQVIAVVELQGPQLSERSRKRGVRMARILKAGGIPLGVWREDALPSIGAAREAILAHLPPTAVKPPAAEAAPAAAAKAVVPQASPFDDAYRDSIQDERIELLEPPPTWYDELDSDTVPLDKR